MDEQTAKELAETAAAIARETAEQLKKFTKDTAMLLYAYRTQVAIVKMSFPEETVHKKLTNKEAGHKLEKMMEDARLKWKYATDAEKGKAMQMNKIILDSDEKIRAVYKLVTQKITS